MTFGAGGGWGWPVRSQMATPPEVAPLKPSRSCGECSALSACHVRAHYRQTHQATGVNPRVPLTHGPPANASPSSRQRCMTLSRNGHHSGFNTEHTHKCAHSSLHTSVTPREGVEVLQLRPAPVTSPAAPPESGVLLHGAESVLALGGMSLTWATLSTGPAEWSKSAATDQLRSSTCVNRPAPPH